ncbi:DUF418 domain-containing protein [Sphingoaurantiacus capsulatus]|uniref:DUF418 domain-containing protein n=1 Tax=Sphingoaurantiacus capsulatus TaxID=1771310 RepID=A0ABV7XB09_9SPHN
MTRYQSLDAVRGFAVLGILLMNIVGMGLPAFAYMNPTVAGGDSGANLVAWALAYVLVDGKMRALFTLMFGASLLLIADAAEGKSPGAAGTHYRRMFWLLLFGMIHAWAIWFGDILVTYALAGSLAFLFRNMPPRRMIGTGLVILGLLMAWNFMGHFHFVQMRALAEAPGAAPELVAAWKTAYAELAPSGAAVAREIAGYRGGVMDVFHIRAETVIFFQTFLIPTNFVWEALGFMCIGMALFRLGFFTGAWETRTYAKLAAVLIPVGIVFGAPLAGKLWMVRWDPVTTFATDALAIPVHLAMGIGYAAVVIAIVKSGALKGAVERLAAAGRMAFTNYLGASLITTTLFYGYGFGLYGRFERAELYWVVFSVWAFQLTFSKPWLDRFNYGPFEWLWRSLVKMELQPMRRIA